MKACAHRHALPPAVSWLRVWRAGGGGRKYSAAPWVMRDTGTARTGANAVARWSPGAVGRQGAAALGEILWACPRTVLCVAYLRAWIISWLLSLLRVHCIVALSQLVASSDSCSQHRPHPGPTAPGGRISCVYVPADMTISPLLLSPESVETCLQPQPRTRTHGFTAPVMAVNSRPGFLSCTFSTLRHVVRAGHGARMETSQVNPRA